MAHIHNKPEKDSQVSFVGSKSAADAKKGDANKSAIHFATDNHQIIVNGEAYGEETASFTINKNTQLLSGTITDKTAMEVLRSLFTATYAPMYTAPTITSETKLASGDSTPGSYVIVGQSATFTPTLTLTGHVATAKSSDTASSGDIDYEATGGSFTSITVNGVSKSASENKVTVTAAAQIVNSTADTIGTTPSTGNVFTVSANGIFSAGPEDSIVKDSSGKETNKASTETFGLDIENASEHVDIDSETYTIKEITGVKAGTFTNSWSIKSYANIYVPKAAQIMAVETSTNGYKTNSGASTITPVAFTIVEDVKNEEGVITSVGSVTDYWAGSNNELAEKSFAIEGATATTKKYAFIKFPVQDSTVSVKWEILLPSNYKIEDVFMYNETKGVYDSNQGSAFSAVKNAEGTADLIKSIGGVNYKTWKCSGITNGQTLCLTISK